MSFAHIILTRFNLPTKGRESKFRHSNGWLKNRFQLFENFCLPSVIGQSNQNFYWLILFDKHTPEPFRSRAEKYALENIQIKILWVENVSLNLIQTRVRSLVPSKTVSLITTRLDNDDAINIDFIKTIQATTVAFVHSDKPQVINYDNGVTFHNGRSYLHQDTSNAFASLIEPFSENINTIWYYPHADLYRFGKMINLDSPMMWMQVIHGKNVSNRIRGYRIRSNEIPNKFKLRTALPCDEKNWSIRLENLFISPIRFFKEYCRAKVKHVLTLVNTLR